MKKLFIFLVTAAAMCSFAAAVLTASASAAGGGKTDLQSRQEEVHQAAELLRELGVSEDSEAIRALSDEWWRCQAKL